MPGLLDGIDTTPPGAGGSGLLDGIDTTPPQPGMMERGLDAIGSWGANNLPAAGKLAARTGLHLLEGPADLAVGLGRLIGDRLDKTGFTTPAPPLIDTSGKPLGGTSPSNDMVNDFGLSMDKNAGVPMRVADFVLPFLASGGRSALGRIGEAEGLANKTAEGLGYLTGAGADAAASYGGATLGEKYIGGPGGSLIGSLLGGVARPTFQQLSAFGGRKAIGGEDAGNVFDSMTSEEGPGTLPTFGQVTDNTGKRLEKAAGSFPVLGWGVNAARDAAEEGIKGSVETGIGKVATPYGEADRGPIAGPVNPAITGNRISEAARGRNASLQDINSTRQENLQTAIEGGPEPSASPVVQQISGMLADRSTSAPAERALQPRYDDLLHNVEKANPPDPVTNASPYPPTMPYGVYKDLRTDLREGSERAPAVQGRYLDDTEGAYTGVMRGAADTAGVGPEFDAANQAYARFKNAQQPWLEQQGGKLDPGSSQPSGGTISGRADAMVGPNPRYLQDIRSNLGAPVAQNTLADVLSRLGMMSKKFAPSQWGKDYAGVNDTAKGFIAQNAAGATPYLENAATGGRAFDLAPERPGLSQSMGWLASAADAISKAPRAAAAMAGGLETPSIIRAMAGRTDIPAIVAQYAMRQAMLEAARRAGASSR